jgi:hypothetical protein
MACSGVPIVEIGGTMRRALVLAAGVALLAAACSSETNSESTEAVSATTTQVSTTAVEQTTTTAAAVTTTAAPAATTTTEGSDGPESNLDSPLVVLEIDFDASFVLIRNAGTEDYDLSGHWICNKPSYNQLPDQVLAPGDVIEFDARLLGLDADSGELALYTSGDFESSEDIIRYVQWGSDSHGRTDTAVAGGIWPEGDFVDNQGSSIESSGSNPVSSADWSSI